MPFESKRYQFSIQRTITPVARKSTVSPGTKWAPASARGLVVTVASADREGSISRVTLDICLSSDDIEFDCGPAVVGNPLFFPSSPGIRMGGIFDIKWCVFTLFLPDLDLVAGL